ncbi:MAG TPA: hypothetical protein VFI21_14815 [Nocardioides sp.]|jgi:hypothetical protein|nr:hypothetical protein [Nocardioides sp.]
MGRHVDASPGPLGLRRSSQLAGLVGGAAWVVASFLADGAAARAGLLPIGAVLLTVALLGLGLLLVRSDFLALRVFVAVAVPALVWGVFAIVHQSVSDPQGVDAAFGAVVGLVCGAGLAHRSRRAPRATL